MPQLKIISWNVNGIRSAHRKGFPEWVKKTRADIVCVQETRIDETALTAELRAPSGHHAAWAFAEKKGYSGVATFSKLEPIAVRTGIGIAEFDREGRVVETEFDTFRLFNVYFPKGSGTLRDNSRVPYKLAFYDALMDHVLRKRKPAIVVGDFNTAHQPIDLTNAKQNVRHSGFLLEERTVFARHLQRGFIDTFRHLHPDRVQYSWWREGLRERNVGWRIDYVWIHKRLLPHLKQAFISGDVFGSDHCPVGIVLHF